MKSCCSFRIFLDQVTREGLLLRVSVSWGLFPKIPTADAILVEKLQLNTTGSRGSRYFHVRWKNNTTQMYRRGTSVENNDRAMCRSGSPHCAHHHETQQLLHHPHDDATEATWIFFMMVMRLVGHSDTFQATLKSVPFQLKRVSDMGKRGSKSISACVKTCLQVCLFLFFFHFHVQVKGNTNVVNQVAVWWGVCSLFRIFL